MSRIVPRRATALLPTGKIIMRSTSSLRRFLLSFASILLVVCLTVPAFAQEKKVSRLLKQAIEDYDGSPDEFRLPISDILQDPIGISMAIITDAILAKGWDVDGFEQRDGYRIYRYKQLGYASVRKPAGNVLGAPVED